MERRETKTDTDNGQVPKLDIPKGVGSDPTLYFIYSLFYLGSLEWHHKKFRTPYTSQVEEKEKVENLSKILTNNLRKVQ